MDNFLASTQKSDESNGKKNNAVAPVLVVENDPDALLLISELLRGLDFDVIEATNGSEALEKITIFNPALVLMDIEMPVLNGYEATLALRKMERPFCNIPVIAITAHLTNEDIRRYKNAGFNQLISKPFRLEEIQLHLKKYQHTNTC